MPHTNNPNRASAATRAKLRAALSDSRVDLAAVRQERARERERRRREKRARHQAEAEQEAKDAKARARAKAKAAERRGDDDDENDNHARKRSRRDDATEVQEETTVTRRGTKAEPFPNVFWLGTATAPQSTTPPPPTTTTWDDPHLPPLFPEFRAKSKDATTFDKPTPVQQVLWPAALQGHDALAVAPTGSGKTLAFALPAAAHVLGAPKRGRGPIALVMAPTRELVSQIAFACREFRKLWGVQVTGTYGGMTNEPWELAEVDILVSTPGRGRDLMVLQRQVSVKRVTLLVLDEADRMLQMGFKHDLESIADLLRLNRQTIMTTATMSRDALAAADAWLLPDYDRLVVNALDVNVELAYRGDGEDHHPSTSTAGQAPPDSEKRGGAVTLSDRVAQIVHLCAEHKKPRKLIRHIERVKAAAEAEGKRQPGPMLIFCNQIKTVLFVLEFLLKQKVRAAALHGGMKQDMRERTLADFRAGKHAVLVATDVAARGLHLPALEHVVNYDFPPELSLYAHRVGRAGRGGNVAGTALSFLTRIIALHLAPDLVTLLRKAGHPIDPNLDKFVERLVAPPPAPSSEDPGEADGVVDENGADVDVDAAAAAAAVADGDGDGADGDEEVDEDDTAAFKFDGTNDDSDDEEESALRHERRIPGIKPLVTFVPGASAATKKKR